jgi:hypothetical protein
MCRGTIREIVYLCGHREPFAVNDGYSELCENARMTGEVCTNVVIHSSSQGRSYCGRQECIGHYQNYPEQYQPRGLKTCVYCNRPAREGSDYCEIHLGSDEEIESNVNESRWFGSGTNICAVTWCSNAITAWGYDRCDRHIHYSCEIVNCDNFRNDISKYCEEHRADYECSVDGCNEDRLESGYYCSRHEEENNRSSSARTSSSSEIIIANDGTRFCVICESYDCIHINRYG